MRLALRAALTALTLSAIWTAQPAAAQLRLPSSGSPAAPPPAPIAPAAPPVAPASGAAASPEEARDAAAVLAAQGWLTLLDRRDWGRAWEVSASVFRQAVPLGAWMDAIGPVRARMGDFKDRTALPPEFKTSLPGRPTGEYVTVGFQSEFSNTQVTEVVTVTKDTDGRWKVMGYQPK